MCCDRKGRCVQSELDNCGNTEGAYPHDVQCFNSSSSIYSTYTAATTTVSHTNDETGEGNVHKVTSSSSSIKFHHLTCQTDINDFDSFFQVLFDFLRTALITIVVLSCGACCCVVVCMYYCYRSLKSHNHNTEGSDHRSTTANRRHRRTSDAADDIELLPQHVYSPHSNRMTTTSEMDDHNNNNNNNRDETSYSILHHQDDLEIEQYEHEYEERKAGLESSSIGPGSGPGSGVK